MPILKDQQRIIHTYIHNNIKNGRHTIKKPPVNKKVRHITILTQTTIHLTNRIRKSRFNRNLSLKITTL